MFASFAHLDVGVVNADWTFVEYSAATKKTVQQSLAGAQVIASFGLAVRRSVSLVRRGAAIIKRFNNARFTYYKTGLGACGHQNQPSDFIVAMNSPQYESGAHCGQKIQIQINGKSAIAEVVDECPGCGYGNLDFSEGLFKHFGNTEKGTLYGSWMFVDGQHGGSKKHHSRDFFVAQKDTTSSMTAAQAYASIRSVVRRWVASGLSILRRHNNARFTYYETGLGACGHENKPSDFIVAMNSPQYQSGAHCGQKVKIEVNGKSAIAEVVDECPGCGYGNLDLSEGLFRHFADTKEGVLYGSWSFVDEHHGSSKSHRSRSFVST
jgi:expansin (peptidoglycan-binding protein)